jgi:ubiquinone/menaquinone biosynthesis C-methylase UbiE
MTKIRVFKSDPQGGDPSSRLILSDKKEKYSVQGINDYQGQLTADQLQQGHHRSMVGGHWDQMGALQMAFLLENGLKPEHHMLDIGCGSLRGGLHFVDYLEPGCYFGMDINRSLLEGGVIELKRRGLFSKGVTLFENDRFELTLLNQKFDVLLAVSVFTHLFMNNIVRCLKEVSKVLKPHGQFYATFFESKEDVELRSLTHQPGSILTDYDKDNFHNSFHEYEMMAELVGLDVKYIGDWGHPRAQKMLAFSLPAENK